MSRVGPKCFCHGRIDSSYKLFVIGCNFTRRGSHNFPSQQKSFWTGRGFSTPSQISILTAVVKAFLEGREITLCSDASLLTASASRHLLRAALLDGNVLAACRILSKISVTQNASRKINYKTTGDITGF